MNTCIQCSKLFNKSAYMTDTICSRKCKAEYNKKIYSVVKQCPVCNVEFTYDMRKERTVCSVSCQHIYQKNHDVIVASRTKIKNTLLKKYGVDHNSKIDGFVDRRRNTNLTKYGVYHYTNREKAKQTLLDKHGNINYNNTAKIQKTMLERYGVSFFSQSPLFKQRLLDRYGVEHPLHTPENRKRLYKKVISKLIDVTPKFDENDYNGVNGNSYTFECNTCNVEFTAQLDDGHLPICRVCHPINKTKSKCEYEIIDWLRTVYDGPIIHGDRTVLIGKELDIYLPELSLAIELNGLYYHSEITGKKNKSYHLTKTKQCSRLGITLLHILDIEWSHKKEIIKSILLNIVKPNMITKFHARKCTIREITAAAASKFLNENHIQGSDTSSIRIGLFYNDELVSLLTFGKNRFNKEITWEMYRFCNKINSRVHGGLGKLYKYFIVTYNPDSILTFSDRRYFTGNAYDKIGFKLTNTTSPNYHYFRINDHTTVFSSRNRFQKHKLSTLLERFDPHLTEWQNMQLNGYDRIWDCGNTKWVWYRQ